VRAPRSFVVAFSFAFVAMALGACDVPTPSVVVRFEAPASPANAVRVEVSLLASCEGQVPGEAAVSPITMVEVTPTRSQPLGTFDRGSYGLYGRAFDDSCTVVAAGCDVVSLGDDDPLEVHLTSLAGETCSAGERCASEGRCVAADAGSSMP
jgi:hypothetical protein